MTLQNRNKIILVILLVITIVNVAAVLTFIYHVRYSGNNVPEMESGVNTDSVRLQRGPAYLMQELGFDEGQQERFHQSHDNFRKGSRPVFMEMRRLNAAIIDEVSKDQPDTAALRQMSLRAGELHSRIKMNTIRHLLEVGEIATPEQQEKLDLFYRDLISRDAPQMGKGNQHRHRRGQNAPVTE